MKLEKSFVFKMLKTDLEEKYGEKKASSIFRYANAQLKKLESSEPDADKTSRSYVFPAVAIYRAIEHYFPGKALEITRNYGTETGLRMKKVFRRMTALPGVPTLMWKNMDRISGKLSSGYDCKNVTVTEHLCSMDVVSCPLYEKAKELGTPEAVQMICCMDKEYMNGFRGIDYTRTKSVAEGDDCCDYRLKDSRDKKMTGAEKLMTKKGTIKAELDRQTPCSDVLWQKATARLNEIQDKYGALPKGLQPHTDRIFPAAAIYLTIKDELGEKTAYSVIENAAITGCAGIARKLEKLMKVPGMSSLFVNMWDPMTKKIFGAGNGFKNVFYPKKKGEYRMDIVSCPYCRYMTELGCPELTKIFCENDERVYGNLPGLKFERTGTLGKGAKRCDFYLRKVQTKD